MRVKLKNLVLSSGEVFNEVEADIPEHFTKNFLQVEDPEYKGHLEFIAPEYIVSFELEPLAKPRKMPMTLGAIENPSE